MLSVSSEHSFNHFFDNLTFRFIAFGYPHPALQWKNKQAKYSKYLYLPNFMKVKSLQVIQTMTAINLKLVHKRTDPDYHVFHMIHYLKNERNCVPYSSLKRKYLTVQSSLSRKSFYFFSLYLQSKLRELTKNNSILSHA